LTTGVGFPGGAEILSLHHHVQTCCGVHPSYLVGSGGYYTGVRRPERETGHLPSSSAQVKNAWSYTSTRGAVLPSARHKEKLSVSHLSISTAVILPSPRPSLPVLK